PGVTYLNELAMRVLEPCAPKARSISPKLTPSFTSWVKLLPKLYWRPIVKTPQLSLLRPTNVWRAKPLCLVPDPSRRLALASSWKTARRPSPRSSEPFRPQRLPLKIPSRKPELVLEPCTLFLSYLTWL